MDIKTNFSFWQIFCGDEFFRPVHVSNKEQNFLVTFDISFLLTVPVFTQHVHVPT